MVSGKSQKYGINVKKVRPAPGAFGKGNYLKKICKHERTLFSVGEICSRCFKILKKNKGR
jgi:hypothetical protein